VISDGRSGARKRVIRHHEWVAGDADPNVQRFRRAFHWGALVIMDASSTDVPTQPAESGVATTDAGLMVPVRHAQDVDYEGLGLGPEEAVPPFEVEVEVRTGPPNGPISAEHTVRITSGALTIGDADDEIRVDVEPGGVRIAVYLDLDDPRHAERVRIWLTPDTGK
jgi:hypothetical protein